MTKGMTREQYNAMVTQEVIPIHLSRTLTAMQELINEMCDRIQQLEAKVCQQEETL